VPNAARHLVPTHYSRYMRTAILADLAERLEGLARDGLTKHERVITSPQSAHIRLADGRTVLNLCANNYLGLADHPALVEAAQRAVVEHGYGMASVRFICGTQDVHKRARGAALRVPRHRRHDPVLVVLRRERRPLRDAARREDAIISDALNHASIIDGIRLCKAQRHRYPTTTWPASRRG
jgi:glycine C-acetyltransferase